MTRDCFNECAEMCLVMLLIRNPAQDSELAEMQYTSGLALCRMCCFADAIGCFERCLAPPGIATSCKYSRTRWVKGSDTRAWMQVVRKKSLGAFHRRFADFTLAGDPPPPKQQTRKPALRASSYGF